MSILATYSLATYSNFADFVADGWIVHNESQLTLLPTGGAEGQPCVKFTFDSDVTENIGNESSYGELLLPWTHSVNANFVGFMFKLHSLPNDYTHGVIAAQGRDDLRYYHVVVQLDSDGQLIIKNQATGDISYSGLYLNLDVWYHLSFKVDVQNSPNGSFELNVNGTTVISETGLDTLYSEISGEHKWLWGCNDNISTQPTLLSYSISDIHIQDDQGGSIDDHLGAYTRVSYLGPDADGATTDFTPSAGASNYLMVDETVNHDYDTTRNVSDGTLTHKDTLSLAALDEPTKGVIHAIKALVVAKKSDATARTIKLIQKGTAEGLSAAITLTEDYVEYSEFFLTHPDTATAWTKTQLAAGEFGYGNDT